MSVLKTGRGKKIQTRLVTTWDSSQHLNPSEGSLLLEDEDLLGTKRNTFIVLPQVSFSQ